MTNNACMVPYRTVPNPVLDLINAHPIIWVLYSYLYYILYLRTYGEMYNECTKAEKRIKKNRNKYSERFCPLLPFSKEYGTIILVLYTYVRRIYSIILIQNASCDMISWYFFFLQIIMIKIYNVILNPS